MKEAVSTELTELTKLQFLTNWILYIKPSPLRLSFFSPSPLSSLLSLSLNLILSSATLFTSLSFFYPSSFPPSLYYLGMKFSISEMIGITNDTKMIKKVPLFPIIYCGL